MLVPCEILRDIEKKSRVARWVSPPGDFRPRGRLLDETALVWAGKAMVARSFEN